MTPESEEANNCGTPLTLAGASEHVRMFHQQQDSSQEQYTQLREHIQMFHQQQDASQEQYTHLNGPTVNPPELLDSPLCRRPSLRETLRHLKSASTMLYSRPHPTFEIRRP